jgi:hypothetical protein
MRSSSSAVRRASIDWARSGACAMSFASIGSNRVVIVSPSSDGPVSRSTATPLSIRKPCAARPTHVLDVPVRRDEAGPRVLGIEPRLDRVPVEPDVGLLGADRFALCDPELIGDQVATRGRPP